MCVKLFFSYTVFYLFVLPVTLILIGFTSPADSTEFSNGITSSGALVTSASGNFTKSFAVLQRDAGPAAGSDYYSLALNNNIGVTINAGQTLTFRLYFAAGSTGATRFAFLKNVVAKGVANSTVPLQLISFNAVANDNVKLSWKTEQEINTSHFIVERSLDARSFTALGRVEATGSNNVSAYTYVDNIKPTGKTFYRLRMYDRDGSFSYSRIVEVSGKGNLLSIYPNPVKDNLTVSLPHNIGAGAILQLQSVDGKVVMNRKLGRNAGTEVLDLTSLPAGVYGLVLINNSERTYQTVIKK